MKLESQLQIYTLAGVAPFTVNQATLVTNLNAQYLEGQIGSYYRNAGNLDAGALLAARLPAFTGGDVTSTAGTVALTLAFAGTAGTYRSVTTDAKGRVTAGTNPTTLAGYGITDALLLSGGTLTGELVINYSNGRQRITDGTNTLVMGMWDAVNVRIEATGRPLYMVSYGGAISIGRSSGTNLVIDTASVSWGSNALLHAGNVSTYALPIGGGTVTGQVLIGSYMSLNSNASIMGLIGFNRNVTTGAIFNASYGAYQLHNNTGTLELQTYNAAGGFVGAHTFNNSGNVAFLTGTVTAGGNQVLHAGNFSSYALPYAGGTLTGAITATNHIGPGTGLTGNAASLTAGAVPWSGITSKPTTISGYGITDIVSSNSGSPVAADTTTKNGFYYVNSNISLFGQTDGALFVQAYDGTWASQIYQDYRTGQLAIRGRNSGTWQAWRTVLDSTNFLTAAPNSGVTAGTYNNVTVNAKGLVTGGSNASYLTSNQSISITGDATGSGSTGIVLTLANVLATPGTYTKVTANAKGLITAGTSLTSADLPTYTGTITSGQVTTGLGFTPAYGTDAYQSKSLDTVSTPGLYQYDGAFGGTKPPDNQPNYRTIEIGSGSRWTQVAFPYASDGFYFRRKTDAAYSSWRTVLHDGNYNSYSPTLGGTGATGNWPISITGNASGSSGSCTGNAATATGQQSGVHFTLNTGGAGYGLVGQYNPDLHQGLFAMGSAYTLGAGGTLANFYGVSWSYDNTGRQLNTGYGLEHCMAISNAGVVRTVIGIGIWTNGLIRANGAISSGGTITAAAFSGPLTGNVTGNITGSAGSVAWTNVSGRPTAVSSFSNDSGYITSGSSISGSSRRIEFVDGPRNLSDRLPTTLARSVNWDFVGAATGNGAGNYAGVMTFTPWDGTSTSTGDSSYQLAFANQSGVNASGPAQLSIRNGINSTWNAWQVLLTSSNYTSYPDATKLPLAGGTLTGALNGTTAAFSGTITQGGNQVLHAGNFSSYALPYSGGTLTGSITATNHIGPGTGLTGTAPGLNIGGNANNIIQYTVNQSVGTSNSPSFTGLSVINTITGAVSGNSGTVTNATFYRQFTVRDDRSDGGDYSLAGRPTGLYAIAAAGTNGPGATYLSLIHAANSNDVAFQIAGGYTSDAMYFRGTYALQNGTGYSTWRTVIHSGNIASQTVATADSCTGSAAQLNGQAASYYENRDTTAVGFSAGTLTLTRAAGNLTVSLDGRYLTANQTITLNGDVTGSGTTAITTTIANSTVTNAKLNTMGAATIKGNNGAVANSPLDLTVAQVATMMSGQAMNINGSSASCTGNAASASSLAADTSTRFKILTFTGEGGDSGNGALPTSYGIYQQGGSWTHPYPDLCIGFHTGIKIGAYFGYGGTRFFNNSDWATEIFSVGNGDSNVRVVNTIYAAAFSGPLTGNVTGNVTGNLTGLASSATTAGNVNGYSTSTGVGANTIVVRDASGYIYGHYINTNVSESENPSINSFFTSNGDGWLRKSTVAHVKYTLSLSGTNTGDQINISGSSGSCTGNAASVTDGVYLSTNQSISGVKTFSSAPVATNIAKAWVHYNMNTNTINASYNVSSVTDNGTGDCTVNFSSSMVDANYVVAGTATYGYDNQVIHAMILAVPRISNAQQAGSCRLVTEYIHAAGVYDSAAVRAVFYR